jgi:hypothetical protein
MLHVVQVGRAQAGAQCLERAIAVKVGRYKLIMGLPSNRLECGFL